MNASTQQTPAGSELVEANERAASYFRQRLLSVDAAGPRSYLESRGFAHLLEDTRWTIGYAQTGWASLQEQLLREGFSRDTLLAAGLISTTRRGGTIDRFRDRLTFGIRDVDSNLVGFTARCSPGAPDSVPKYLNTPRTAIYDKSAALFGLGEQASRLRDGYNLIVVEGPLDALAVDRVNVRGTSRLAALALCGTAMTPRHGEIVSQLVNAHVIVAFDRDQAGNKAAESTYGGLRARLGSLFAATLPNGSDPAQSLLDSGPDGLLGQLTRIQPLADSIIDNHLAAWPNLDENAEARVACLRDVARVTARMTPDDATNQARRLPAILGLDQETVTRELAEAVSAPSSTPPSLLSRRRDVGRTVR